MPTKVSVQGDQLAALQTELQSVVIGDQIIRHMAIGLARAINSPLFTTNTVVDAVHISDGRLDVVTHQGVRIGDVSMRIDGIDVNTEPGREEFRLNVYEGAGYGYTWRTLRYDMKLGQNEPS